MAATKAQKRKLYKNKEKVLTHWNIRHAERNKAKLIRIAEYELFNFTWIATVNAFIEQGKLSNRKKVLDIGFGWGRTILGLKTFLPEIDITGIELNNNAIENAKIVLKNYLGDYSNIKLEVGDAETLQYEENSFDAVLSTRVFQYLKYPQVATDHMYRVLIPKGRAVVMVPNKINIYQFLFYHTHRISPFTLKKWFYNAGFKKIRTGSIIFFHPGIYLFSSESPWVKIEKLITKVPIINMLGGITWVSGEK